MAANDPVQDRYNPPAVTHTDFESSSFNDLNVDELFWLQNERTTHNVAFRKINEHQGLNTITRQIHNFSNKIMVYQKL